MPMIRQFLPAIICVLCFGFKPGDSNILITKKGNKVLVNDKVYCLYEETQKGSRGFQISTPDSEVVIMANVKVKNIVHDTKVHNYINVLFVPSAQELNLTYDRRFKDRFLESLAKHDVLQSGIWNEAGAAALFKEWSLSPDAIIEPETGDYIRNSELSQKISGVNIRIDSGKYIYLNDTHAYTYKYINNWTKGYQYKKGWENAYYYIYDRDSNLRAEIRIGDERSTAKRNISMIMMPEQQMYYLTNLKARDERSVLSTAVKMLLLSK